MSTDLRPHRLSVALVHPQIAPNTGNVGRLCVATGTRLHLVRPMGFVLSDRNLQRAGMDYWRRLTVTVHDDLPTFLSTAGRVPWLFTARGDGGRSVWDCPFADGDCLAFGSETHGLPDALLAAHPGRHVRIPQTPGERCLNLSTAVGIGLYEAARQIGRTRPFVPSESPDGGAMVPGMQRILVVDDHVANCVPLVKLFRFAGYEARCVSSGPDALAAVAADPFDAMLLDVMMPDMDGFAVLRTLRADRRYDAMPILMYTASVDPESHTRAIGLGAQGYIVKGTGFDELRRAVELHLPKA